MEKPTAQLKWKLDVFLYCCRWHPSTEMLAESDELCLSQLLPAPETA